MKLYTEEQVRKMLQVCIDSDLYEHILTFEDILKTETPIELPSDEDTNQDAVDDYNKMEEEWEMENYNQMKEEQSE
jgi:hypothetical protein